MKNIYELIEITAGLMALVIIFDWRHLITGSAWDAVFALSCGVSGLVASVLIPVPVILQHEISSLTIWWMVISIVLFSIFSYTSYRFMQNGEL